MTDRDALYRSILENPADNTVRRVYADFIREQGEDTRADFIELQLQIAELIELGVHKERSCNVTGLCDECSREGEVRRLQDLEETLMPVNLNEWFPDLTRFSSGYSVRWRKDAIDHGFELVGNPSIKFNLRRGFISSVLVTSNFWQSQQPNNLSLYGFKNDGTVFNSQGARLVVTHPIARVDVHGFFPNGHPILGGERYPFSFRSGDVTRAIWDLLYPNRFVSVRAAHDKLSWVYLTLARREAGLPNLPWDSSNDLKD